MLNGSVCNYSIPEICIVPRQPGLYIKHLDSPEVLRLSNYIVGNHLLAVDIVALPGGMGISRQLFLRIFLPIFGNKLLLPGMSLKQMAWDITMSLL